MSNSLRSRVNKLAYQGHITKKDAEKIREALKKDIPAIPIDLGSWSECRDCGEPLLYHKYKSKRWKYCPMCGRQIDWGNK